MDFSFVAPEQIGAIALGTVIFVILYKYFTSNDYDAAVTKARQEMVVLDLPVKRVELDVNGAKCSMTYLEVTPDSQDDSKPQVLLLHGARFFASTWNTDMGTLNNLKEWGYRAVAVDLKPESEFEKCTGGDSEKKGLLLHQVVEELKLKQVVLVSPSKSGEYSIPYIMNTSSQSELAGFIPVAPVIGQYTTEDFAKLDKLKTLIVQGENDATIGPASLRKLQVMPNSKVVTLAGAGHACYLDRPDVWHTELKAFLDGL